MDAPPLILLVDDDPTALAMLSAILRQEGLEVVTASSLQQTKALLSASPLFDLAILDVHLPDGSGLDLCASMRDGLLTNDAPVLIVSTDEDIDTKIAGFDAGAVDYITKPFHRAEVLARVRTHIRLHKARLAIIELQALKLSKLACAQRAMVPKPEQMPEAGFDLYYRPMQEAGGDLCQVLELGSHIHDYIVADVCGHDVGAAMTMSSLYALFRQNCSALYSPREVLRIINRVACSLLAEEQFATVVYARINRKTRRLTVVSGGHPPAVIQKVEGSILPLWLNGDVVGAFENAEFGMLTTSIKPGDRVFLFSDSIIEGCRATNWEAGVEEFVRLCEKLRHRELHDEVVELAGLATMQGAPADDISLMGIEV
jgi:sigma-B regulation protein RsbU (phosphoserine phosphatase)